MTSASDIETILAGYEAAASAAPWAKPQASDDEALWSGALTALDLFHSAPGDAPALFYFDRCFTYGEIDRLGDHLAGWLSRMGVGRGDRIAVILQNVPQFLIATIAAWKLGAIVVSLNPMYRAPELAKLFDDCAPKAVVCHDDQWETVSKAAAGRIADELVLWTSGREFQARDDARVLPPPGTAPAERAMARVLDEALPPPPDPGLSPDDIGLLLYTSGTTGAPKGAMLTHRNLVANAIVSRDHFELDGASRIFGMAPLFHITGFELQIVAAFAAGASQVITYRFHPSVALEAFVEYQPTFMVGAITAFIALMNLPEATRDHFASFARLYSGGAPIAPAVTDAFAERFGHSIRGAYGMTELTSPSHLTPNDGLVPVDPKSGALSIGKPIPGVRVIVVDDERRPLGPGEYGEVVVHGPGVTQGYWGKPKETGEALLGGWMHTGDVGFYDEEGWFYLVDRKKDMISASGFKVWPREVEDVLYAFPGVREAAVVGAPDAYRGETVVAFVSAKQGMAIDPAELTRFCRERLAAYKCPAEIHVMDDLPKTVTGKITRNVLKQGLDKG